MGAPAVALGPPTDWDCSKCPRPDDCIRENVAAVALYFWQRLSVRSGTVGGRLGDRREMDGVIIDVRDQGTTELDHVDSRARKKAVFAFLQDNHLSEWVVVGRLGASLRVLDISNNLLTVLPEQSFWENAVALQFLYLHDNAITSLPSINDLVKLRSLIGLSLHGNPLASRPTYRRIVLAILPGIKMIDNYLVSDQERLRDVKMGEDFKPMGPAFCFPKFQTEFGVQLPECRRTLNAYVAGLNRAYARLSPIITIQTAVRNWIGRRHRPRIDRSLESMIDRISFLPQGDMEKEADEDDAETGSEASVEDPEREKARVTAAAARQQLMQQLASSVVLVGTDPLGVFHRMLTQVQSATPENSRTEGAKESLDFYKSVPLSLFLDTRGHMHAYHEDRTMEQCIEISSRWSRMLPCPMIRRRLCHVRTIDRDAFDRGCLYRNQAVYNDARRLHRFTLPDFVSRDMLIRLVENYNTGAQEPIVVFTYKMALAQWAALAIQSTWRSYKVRTVWLPSLSLARIFHRARNCIIHWWRYRLLRLRMEMLSGARRACEAVTSGDTIVTRRALELVLAAPSPIHRLGLFPEHRTVFDIVRLDENGAQSSAPRIGKPTCTVVHYVDPSTPTRALVPQWFQWNLSGLLEERPPASDVSPFLEKARRLLQWDAVQDIQFETSSGHDGQNAQVLSGVENIAQWHIEFRTMDDARLRAFILYIGTWDPVSRSYCQLRPAVLQSGRFVPVGQEIEYPQAYREVPGKQAAQPEIDTDARQVESGEITNSVNIRGVSALNDQLERHLVEVDSEQLQMHNLDPALVGAQYEFDDDFVCLDDFVWSSEMKSMWEFELDLQHRLDWQTQNLIVRSFDPAVVSDEDTARTPRDRNALMAQSTREQSQKLMEEKDRLESERYAEVREAMERMRDVHQIRVAINRATHRRVESDHCQPEIESARSERDAMIESRINRFKAQRRQFLKDQLVEKRINEVQQRNAKAIDKHTIAIARRAAQVAIEDRVKGLRQKYDAGAQQRSRRIKSIQHSMHFQRQIFQIAKHVTGAQLEENARQRQLQVTRDVQKRRIMDGRRRQYIHNTLLADFNRKRQNAIAQQLQIRDQIEQRRLEMQNNLGLLKAERHHIRAMREMIDEDIDACREDPVQALSDEGSSNDVQEHVRPRPNTQAALLQATDHELLDRISALEELADHVRQACTKAFIT